uniref:Uncharacterized protein n=1 Tax=Manihot esculenta TaxID=3983 RepID=A0A2C9UJX4_MANES
MGKYKIVSGFHFHLSELLCWPGEMETRTKEEAKETNVEQDWPNDFHITIESSKKTWEYIQRAISIHLWRFLCQKRW